MYTFKTTQRTDSPIVNCPLSILHSRKGFTLVELLVVITIIGILASLITVGVRGAVTAAKRARITMELSQITTALERYRSEFGEYPPDLSEGDAVVRHVRKRWPRIPELSLSQILGAVGNAYGSLNGAGQYFVTTGDNVESASVGALALWLGGFPNQDGIFSGFSADPAAPFGRYVGGSKPGQPNLGDATDFTSISFGTQDSKTVFMELTLGKNVRFVNTPNTVFPCIVNQLSSDLFVPYVYFKARSGGGQDAYLGKNADGDTVVRSHAFGAYSVDGWSELGEAAPYAKSGDPFASTAKMGWFAPDTYQLIHPGLDGKFGVLGTRDQDTPFCDENFRSIVTDAVNNNISKADNDNLTNFTEGRDIKSLIE